MRIFGFLFSRSSPWRPMADVDIEAIRGLLALVFSCQYLDLVWARRLEHLVVERVMPLDQGTAM